jgi:hypothetical protein
MTTIAQKLKIKDFPFEIKDSKGNRIYVENRYGFWEKREFNSDGKETHYENSNRYWVKREYDSNGNRIYFEDSNKYWVKREYDSEDNLIYWETTSNGTIYDNRPKTEIQKAIELLTKEGLIVDGKILKQ